MIIDRIYMIVRTTPRSVIYGSGAGTAHEAWDRVIEHELMGTGQTKGALRLQGWRAKRVSIVLEEPQGLVGEYHGKVHGLGYFSWFEPVGGGFKKVAAPTNAGTHYGRPKYTKREIVKIPVFNSQDGSKCIHTTNN